MGLETALAVASFTSSVAQAQQQSAAGKYNQAIQNRNSQIAEQEAQQIEKQKEFDIQRFDQKFTQLQSSTTTRILKTGADLSGTGLRVLRSNAEQAEVERNTIEYNSQVAAAQRREAGNLYRIQGQFAAQQGKQAAMTTLFKGATTLAGSSAGKSLLTNIPNPFATKDLTSTEGYLNSKPSFTNFVGTTFLLFKISSVSVLIKKAPISNIHFVAGNPILTCNCFLSKDIK